MLSISIDSSAVSRRLDDMTARIERFGRMDMPAELLAWQTEDMHRKYPNQEEPDDSSTQTHIWPTSRLVLQKRHEQQEMHSAPRRRRRRPVIVRGHHPILRLVLVERLHERMKALLREKLTWR
jgi:chromatin segregation and condensation protein Rec8/ScpA/Scc1 (kleisin family)